MGDEVPINSYVELYDAVRNNGWFLELANLGTGKRPKMILRIKHNKKLIIEEKVMDETYDNAAQRLLRRVRDKGLL